MKEPPPPDMRRPATPERIAGQSRDNQHPQTASQTTGRQAADFTPFIPLWMEQAGLTVHQYRVLGHLWSRGSGRCFPSLDTIAKSCGIKRGTVCAALKALEEAGLVTRRKRKTKGIRNANEYLLTGPFGAPVKNQSVRLGHHLTGPIGAPPNRSVWGTGNVSSENEPSENETSLFGDGLPAPAKHSGSGTETLAESIYQAYPRKVSKPAAIRAIKRAMKEHGADFLLARTIQFSADIAWKERTFIPYPATWFNEKRFNDDPSEWKQPSQTTTSKPPVNTGRRTSTIEEIS